MMRLTALCVCGTLLAFSSLSWTTADSDEEDLLGDHGSGPCTVTLRPEWPCRQGQDESECPYLFSMPPLTVHLPKQLRELENIMEDLQRLKDNVDQLRKMCADCTVSQSERECERQREREHEVSVGSDRHQDEANRLNETDPKHFSPECGTDGVKNAIEGDGDTDSKKRTHLDEKGGKKWEAERNGSDGGVVKENEGEGIRQQVDEKDGKTQAEGARGKDKLGQAAVPTPAGNEKRVDKAIKRIVENNNRGGETDRNKEPDGKWNSKRKEEIPERGKGRKITSNVKNKEKTEEPNRHVWREETKEAEKKIQTAEDTDRDGIKMSEGHDEHTNKEGEQHRDERKEEMEKGMKVERNNEKPKQTEGIGRAEKAETIKEGEEEEEEEKETGKEIKTKETALSVQRDGDGELASSRPAEGTDFVSISPTPRSSISLSQRHDSDEGSAFTSSPPPAPLSGSTSRLISGMTASGGGGPTQSTGFGAVDLSEPPSPDVAAGFVATVSSLGGTGQQKTSTGTGFPSTTRPEAGLHSSSTTTPTAPHLNLYTAAFLGVTDSSQTAKKNIGSNTKAGMKTLPGRTPKPGTKPKLIKPEADRKLKTKSDRAPDKRPKQDQKQKPPQRKPTTELKPKPAKDPKRVQVPKRVQNPRTEEDLPTRQNKTSAQTPKHDAERKPDPNRSPTQKTKSHQKPSVQKPTSHQRPETLNTTGSDKDPQTDPESGSVRTPIIDQNSIPEEKLVRPVAPEDQKQKPPKKLDEKTKPDRGSTSNHNVTPVQEPERNETTSFTPGTHQKPESTEDQDENLSPPPKSVQDSSPGPELKPPEQKKTPKINQKSKPDKPPKLNPKHPDVAKGQKPKPNLKPKPDQTPPTSRTPETPQPDPKPKAGPDKTPEAESSKTSTSKPLPERGPTTSAALTPGPTSAPRPKPSVHPKPSPETKTDLAAPISSSAPDAVQSSQPDVPPASGPVKQSADMTHPPGEPEFRPGEGKTITQGPETGPFPRIHAEDSTSSPNSRTASDPRPQTAGEPPSIPMTTRPNKILPPPVISSSGRPGTATRDPAPTPESRLRAETLPGAAEEAAHTQTADPDATASPAPSPGAQPAPTAGPEPRPTNPTTSGPRPPAPEASTDSTRELRVKINQVAAFFDPQPGDRSPAERPEDKDGGGRRTDSKPQTPKVIAMAKRDCSDHLLRGATRSGVYLVTPDLRGRSFPVFCDMRLRGGGWTLLQRRQDGSVSFNRTWAEYRAGFGELDGGEFWLGNNMIHLLTRDRDMMLRVELEDFDGAMEYAHYEQFRVASERMRYRLTVGGYSGTAGDALRFSRSYDHNNRPFTTPDRDHDRYPSGNCGAYYSSGWWFDACMAANLNGRYYVGKYKGVRDGIFWGTWRNISTEYYPTNERQSFKAVRMMIRPKGFTP